MPSVTESVSTFNSFIRTLLLVIFLGVFGYGAYAGYEYLIKPQIEEAQATDRELAEAKSKLLAAGRELASAQAKVNEQTQMLAQQETQIEVQLEVISELQDTNEKLETARRLLKLDRRLAKIRVINVGTNTETNETFSDIEFIEVDEEGKVLGEPRNFRLMGDEIRVDSWIVKFADQYIEDADLIRGTSLCVFKSIYGNLDGPQNAHELEEENSRPLAYGRGRVSEFEKKIWDDFWEISVNPDKASEMGIRAGHGQVNYVKAKPGMVYQVELRASDGMTIRPLVDKQPEE